MNFKKRLESVELIISEIIAMSPVQRLMAYSTVKTILDEIEAYVDEHESENLDNGSAGIYIAEMFAPLEALAGLEESRHDEIQHKVWLSSSLDKLRSVHCFDIK